MNLKDRCENYINKKIGRVIIRKVEINGKNINFVKAYCECECGIFKWINLRDIIRGKTISCGCYSKELRTTHGFSGHPIRIIWEDMKYRCYNEKSISYHNYGGRGIKMCNDWLNNFESFYNWCLNNGFKEELELDRRDNNGIYEPSNCRFVTRKKNLRNTRKTVKVTYKGELRPLIDICEELGLNYSLIRKRVHYKNWPVDKILFAPLQR